MTVFISTLNQTAFLFSLILIGFILGKFNFIPNDSSTVIAKLENIVFVPALVMGTFIKNFTIEQIHCAGKIMIISFIIALIIIPIVIVISKCISKDKYERNIYTYGLAFSNFGFMGNAVVSALFPDIFLDYIIFTLPLWILIYLWGVPVLLISGNGEEQKLKQRLKSFLNPMFVAMLIGIVIGIFNIKMPSWAMSVVTVSGDCMSPIAMLLTGITISSIDLKKSFTNLKIYIVSIVRLVLIPAVFLIVANYINLGNNIFICVLCSLAMPLGLNTIVIPSAYGKDTSVAAGMAVVSHLLSCVTIPLIFLFI